MLTSRFYSLFASIVVYAIRQNLKIRLKEWSYTPFITRAIVAKKLNNPIYSGTNI